MSEQRDRVDGKSENAWVFGYGSLMWDPGFPYLERHPALLHGWHRAFSLLSTKAWGSVEMPGLVLTLEPGGACRGAALKVAAGEWAAVEEYLLAREQAYRHINVMVSTMSGRFLARTFAADPAHPRFVGKLPPARTAQLIAQGRGGKGSSFDYLTGTLSCLEEFECTPNRQLRQLHAEATKLRQSSQPVSV